MSDVTVSHRTFDDDAPYSDKLVIKAAGKTITVPFNLITHDNGDVFMTLAIGDLTKGATPPVVNIPFQEMDDTVIPDLPNPV